MFKTLRILLVCILFLVGCKVTNNDSPINKNPLENNESDENKESEDVEYIVFFDEIEVVKALAKLFLEQTPQDTKDKDFTKPNFYMSGEETDYFDGNNFQGNVMYNTLEKELELNFIIGLGSCTGALDGHRVGYVFDLIEKSINNLDVVEWTGCDNNEIFEIELENKELVNFAMSNYSSIKLKYDK